MITGSGEGIFLSPAFSLIPQFYRDSVEHKIGILEAIAGIGLSIGPLFGGILYQFGMGLWEDKEFGRLFGYTLPFFYCFLTTIAIIPLARKHIPDAPLDQGENNSPSVLRVLKESNPQIASQTAIMNSLQFQNLNLHQLTPSPVNQRRKSYFSPLGTPLN